MDDCRNLLCPDSVIQFLAVKCQGVRAHSGKSAVIDYALYFASEILAGGIKAESETIASVYYIVWNPFYGSCSGKMFGHFISSAGTAPAIKRIELAKEGYSDFMVVVSRGG